MDKKQHNRTTSQGRKLLPAQGRPTRPAPLARRGNSYTTLSSQGHASSSSKLLLGSNKKGGTEVVYSNDGEESGIASFPQFCTTCDKQIVTPGTSILYCSESCRKKDASRPAPDKAATLSPSLNISTANSYFDMPQDIVAPRSPTVMRPASLTFSDLSMTECDSSSDEEEEEQDEDFDDQQASEASRYLAQFHSRDTTEEPGQTRRAKTNWTSTASENGIPSLSHTPSSSVGTVASMPSYRPLPTRHDPLGSLAPTKSVELVMPTFSNDERDSDVTPTESASLTSSVSTLTPHTFVESEQKVSDKYRGGRKHCSKNDSRRDSNLKNLFSHDAMQAAPEA